MKFFIKDTVYGISGISSGIYIFYLFFKYKKMDYDEIRNLPESNKERKIKLRVESYGWIAMLSGIGCLLFGVYFLFLALN
jgi:hypothetical protein